MKTVNTKKNNMPEWYNHALNEKTLRLTNHRSYTNPDQDWLHDPQTVEVNEVNAYLDNISARKNHYSDQNTIGCGTTNYEDGVNLTFAHAKFIWDTPGENDDPKKLKAVEFKQFQKNKELLIVDIPDINYDSYPNNINVLRNNYIFQTLHLLRSHTNLGTKILIIQADGNGNYLNMYNDNSRDIKNNQSTRITLNNALIYTIKDFYYRNQNSGVEKIVITTYRHGSSASTAENRLAQSIKDYNNPSNDDYPNRPIIEHEVLTAERPLSFIKKYQKDHPELKIGISRTKRNIQHYREERSDLPLSLDEVIELTTDITDITKREFNTNIDKPIEAAQVSLPHDFVDLEARYYRTVGNVLSPSNVPRTTKKQADTTSANATILSGITLSLLSAALATYISTTQLIKASEPLSATRITVITTLTVALAIASIGFAALSYNTHKNKPKAQGVEVECVNSFQNTKPNPTV